MICKCDARFSGLDEAEWCARGAPSCICKCECDCHKPEPEGWNSVQCCPDCGSSLVGGFDD